MDDETMLLKRARGGDDAALLALLTRYQPLIRRIASQEENPSNREDLKSELTIEFLQLVRYYGRQFRSFPGYAKATLLHCLSRYQKQQIRCRMIAQRYEEKMLPEEFTYQMPWENPRPQVTQAMRALPEKDKHLLRLRLRPHPPSWKDLGQYYQEPPSTLHSRYRKILKKLRETIEA